MFGDGSENSKASEKVILSSQTTDFSIEHDMLNSTDAEEISTSTDEDRNQEIQSFDIDIKNWNTVRHNLASYERNNIRKHTRKILPKSK